jgi:hypothetical protein
MITKIIEATNGELNWGKFMLGKFDANEWHYRSVVAEQPLLRGIGTNPACLWVLDLQTGEGAYFRPHGNAHADLNKHKIWVCPLFEPFLTWLYKQDVTDFDKLPDLVDLPEAEFAFAGYRRPGPDAP